MEPLNNATSVDTQQIDTISKIRKSRRIFRILFLVQLPITIFLLIFSIYCIKQYIELEKTCNDITYAPSCIPNPFDKWLDYKNNITGINLRYPPLWTYKEDNVHEKIIFSTKNDDSIEKKQQEITDFISIQIFTDEEFLKWKISEKPTQLTSQYIQGDKYDKYIIENGYQIMNYVHKTNSGKIFILSKYPYTNGNYVENSGSIITELVLSFKFAE
ncbi:MAG: hypothetical protein ABIJ05_02800 [Patescibacteria group bacterium]